MARPEPERGLITPSVLKDYSHSMVILLLLLPGDSLACATDIYHRSDPWFTVSTDGELDSCLTFLHLRSTDRSTPNRSAALVSICFAAAEAEQCRRPVHVLNAAEWELTSLLDAAIKGQDKLHFAIRLLFSPRLVVDSRETSQRARKCLNQCFDTLNGSLSSALTLSGYNSQNSCFALVVNHQPFTFKSLSCFSLNSAWRHSKKSLYQLRPIGFPATSNRSRSARLLLKLLLLCYPTGNVVVVRKMEFSGSCTFASVVVPMPLQDPKLLFPCERDAFR